MKNLGRHAAQRTHPVAMSETVAECGDWRISKMREKGFSLIELCVVVAIVMIVGAMVFINAVTAMENIRLSQAATSYANLIQQVRMRAVQDDTFYTVQTAPAAGAAGLTGFS